MKDFFNLHDEREALERKHRRALLRDIVLAILVVAVIIILTYHGEAIDQYLSNTFHL